MTREERAEYAVMLNRKGYNCAQAVACAYADLVGTDQETMFKVSEGFGGGMGGMLLTCGAVTGMMMVAGMKNSTCNLEQPDSKGKTAKLVRQMAKAFEEKNQSIVCRELKGIDTGVVLRSCPDCIRDAVMIVGEQLFPEE